MQHPESKENEIKTKDTKYIIAGLDNAGKTSSLTALRNKYNFFEQIKNLNPTIKIEYSSFDFLSNWKILIWDMGGQAKYRELYINKPIYFNDTGAFYFFIDIQDTRRLDLAIEYLYELLKIYNDMDYTEDILVCLHKYDPNIRESEEIIKNINYLQEEIKKTNRYGFKFKFFKTSFYDISSLSNAISYSLNKIMNLEPIQVKLRNIVKKYDGDFGVLYTDSGLIISDYFKETMDVLRYSKEISGKTNEDLNLFHRLANFNTEFNERVSSFNNTTEYIKKMNVRDDVIYFKISTPNFQKPQIDEDLKEFKKNLMILLP